MTRSPRIIFAVLPVLVSSGCHSCANDHPYVPPVAEAGALASATTASSGEAPRVGPLEAAAIAPPATTRWDIGGMTLEAGGRELVLGLVGDFDGDGKRDALAIARPVEKNGGGSTGELLLFRGGAPVVLLAGPALGMQSACTPLARLERIGPKAAFAELGSSCPRGGSRAIVVVKLAPVPTVSFDAVVVDPAQAPKLSVDAESADRDGDGIDDVVLRHALEGAPRVEAKLAFFDRPAGPSRDPEEPEASLKPLAAQAAARASKPKDALLVQPLVQQIRALYRAMCLEGGAARITKIHGGSAVPCGSSKALEDAGVAEVRSFVTQGDGLRAFAAASGAQLAPATRTAAKSTELAKMLGEVAPILTGSIRTSSVVPDVPHDRHPEWGPLTFEPGGKLLVRRGKTVLRVDPETGEGEAADATPWKDEVVSPDGKSRFLEAYHACEGVGLHATLAPTGDGDMTDVLLPIPPRLGKTCSGRGEPASATAVSWGPKGLEAIVSGQLVRMNDGRATTETAFVDDVPPQGSPRSPNGRSFVLAIDTGILLLGRGKGWMLVRSPDLEPYGELRRCTVSDDTSRVACVRRGRVVIATLP